MDVWSLGCVTLELALGNEWFKVHWLTQYMTHGARHDRERLVQGLAARREYALELLVADERRASGAGEATGLETAAASYAGLCSFLSRSLEFSPQERLTASDALGHPWLSQLA